MYLLRSRPIMMTITMISRDKITDLSLKAVISNDKAEQHHSAECYQRLHGVRIQRPLHKHTHKNDLSLGNGHRGRKWRLRQASKYSSGLVWPWYSSSWLPKSIVSRPCPVDQLCQCSSKSVYSFPNCRVSNLVTDKRTNGRTTWEHNATASYYGMVKT